MNLQRERIKKRRDEQKRRVTDEFWKTNRRQKSPERLPAGRFAARFSRSFRFSVSGRPAKTLRVVRAFEMTVANSVSAESLLNFVNFVNFANVEKVANDGNFANCESDLNDEKFQINGCWTVPLVWLDEIRRESEFHLRATEGPDRQGEGYLLVPVRYFH